MKSVPGFAHGLCVLPLLMECGREIVGLFLPASQMWNTLAIVNACAHAHPLAMSGGKLLWGLTDCHHFDSLSSISLEQQ